MRHSNMTSKEKVVTRDISFRNFNAVNELEAFLAEMSNRSVDSTMDYQRFTLDALGVEITLPILNLLVQVLTQTLPKTPNSNGLRWDRVDFCRCKFARPGRTIEDLDEEGFCSQDSIEIFASALARATTNLTLTESGEILACLFNTPQLEFHKLVVVGGYVQCAGLGALVQRCASLKDLVIKTDGFGEPVLLAERLTNAFHLESVVFESFSFKSRYRQLETDYIVTPLLSPQSRLKELRLEKMYLKDHHFLTIIEMLPTSQVHVLSLHNNDIGSEGIWSFARQLPKIKCLKKVTLSQNPWEREGRDSNHPSASYKGCITTLLKGMCENYSIECLELTRSEPQLEFCTRANCVRRQISAASDSIPPGLWPWILEQVGTPKSWRPRLGAGLRFQKYKATDALYFVLQNCPILHSARPTTCPSLRRSQRKRKSVDRYIP